MSNEFMNSLLKKLDEFMHPIITLVTRFHATKANTTNGVNIKLIPSWPKWPPFRRRHFQMRFREWKVLYFDYNVTEVCSSWCNWQYPSVGLDTGLALIRRQAIIWTNVDLMHWRIYAALGVDELIHYHRLPCYKTNRRWWHTHVVGLMTISIRSNVWFITIYSETCL